jgi:hypothetical protein
LFFHGVSSLTLIRQYGDIAVQSLGKNDVKRGFNTEKRRFSYNYLLGRSYGLPFLHFNYRSVVARWFRAAFMQADA